MIASVTVPKKQIEALEALFGGGTRGPVRRAMQSAISETVRSGVAQVARRIGEEVHMPIAKIKASIHARRGSFKDPTGEITVDGRKRVWLADFLTAKARVQRIKKQRATGLFVHHRPRGGLKVKIRRRASGKYPGGVERFPHAFTAVTPHSQHVGIFERTGVKRVMKSGRYKGKVREVIKRKQGPRPFGIFVHARGQGGATTVIREIQWHLANFLHRRIASKIRALHAGGRFGAGASDIEAQRALAAVA
ncbi:MAG TPA: hypothetical protein VEA69_15815 [Tepidisphaeraceae bacterium]|nr:hypothetical protein [Tepidisphaeraceae bacterium]